MKFPHPMKLRRNITLAIAAVSLLAIGLAACGSSNNSSSSTTAAATGTTASAGGATVATKSISGVGTVLVDSKGKVRCRVKGAVEDSDFEGLKSLLGGGG